eukprot:5879748-Amphidinium_carterae.1
MRTQRLSQPLPCSPLKKKRCRCGYFWTAARKLCWTSIAPLVAVHEAQFDKLSGRHAVTLCMHAIWATFSESICLHAVHRLEEGTL